MSRGKSSDSTQSTNPPSSTPASPRKKPISLSTSTSTPLSANTANSTPTSTAALSKPTALPPGIAPPPGLTPLVQTITSDVIAPIATAEMVVEDIMPEETMSADSEAGPSSGSPAPQTPVQPTEPSLPAPLTSEPIFVHSPYEEPDFFPFPTTIDPDFEFVLGLDLSGDGDSQANMSTFTPTPFSKTLMGLAELGVLSTDLPDYQTPHRLYTDSFQPFDLSSSLPEDDDDDARGGLDEDDDMDREDEDEEDERLRAGPSRRNRNLQREDDRGLLSTPQNREDQEMEPPRTTSRFDFARQSSSHTPHSYSRGQSPFTMRTASGMGGGVGVGDWGMSASRQMTHQQLLEEQLIGGGGLAQRQHQHQHQQQQQQAQHTGDSRASTLAQQVASFVGSGSYGSSTGGQQEWNPIHSQSQSQSQTHSQGQGSEYMGSPIRLDGRMSQLSLGRPSTHAHTHGLGHGNASQQQQQQHGNHSQGQGQRDDYEHISQYGGPQRLFSPESSIHEDQHYHPHQQQSQQQSQYTPLHQNFYQQQQQQQQQARGQSPVPMSINPHCTFSVLTSSLVVLI